jgi:exopolysaccharide biosynthesis protein
MPSRDPRLVEFQTGPLIIEDGRIRSDLITASINGSSRHTRSLLATMDHRRCYLIAATERMTLVEVAAALLRVPDFRHGRLDVINLDGGSSVALYVQGTRGLWYNEADHLPILIGF